MKRQRYPKNFKEQLVKEAKGKSATLFQLPSDTKLTPKQIGRASCRERV